MVPKGHRQTYHFVAKADSIIRLLANGNLRCIHPGCHQMIDPEPFAPSRLWVPSDPLSLAHIERRRAVRTEERTGAQNAFIHDGSLVAARTDDLPFIGCGGIKASLHVIVV